MSSDFSPVLPWPVQWMCDVSTESPTATGAAVAFATDVLWSLTGQRFGFTTVKLRPTRPEHVSTPYPDGWQPWPGLQAPPDVGSGWGWGWGYYWIEVGSCHSAAEVTLPGPVHAITEVKVDGVILSSSAYRVDGGRLLVRTDGSSWPYRNNLTLPDTSVGTWAITAQYGESVPSGAAVAVGELACEYLRGLSGQDCRLPRAVTQIARQGVTISLPDMASQFEKGLTGLYFCDLFIRTWNPGALRGRARVYSVDRPARGPVI